MKPVPLAHRPYRRNFTVSLTHLVLLALFAPVAWAQTKLYDVDAPTPIDNGLFGVDAIAIGDRNSDGVQDFSVSDQTGVHIFSGVDGEHLFTITGPPDSLFFGVGSQQSFGTPVGLIRNQTSDVIAVGADGANSFVGRAFTFSGSGQLAFTFDSPGLGGFGSSVVDAGDPDGDGFHRIGIGAFAGEGVVYFYDSFSGALTDSVKSPDPHVGSLFGLVLRNMGDLNDDGVDELAVAAPTDSIPGFDRAGRVFLFNGATLQFIYALTSPNAEADGVFGAAMDNIGDVDDDGAADIAVSTFGEDAGGTDAGRVYVFSGVDGTLLFDLFSPNPQAVGRFGRTLAGVGDVDGDGLPDIAVGAADENNTTGRVYVFSGDDQLITTIEPDESAGDSILFGIDLAALGDVNDDGRADLFIGAPGFDRGAIVNAGTGSVWSYMDGGVANETDTELPESAIVESVFPNPFRGSTTIRYTLSEATAVRLAVYDALGREVRVLREGTAPPGRHDEQFDASGFAAGVYVLILDSASGRSTTSLTLLE